MASVMRNSGSDYISARGVVTSDSNVPVASKWSSSMGFPSSRKSLRLNIGKSVKLAGSISTTHPNSKNKGQAHDTTSIVYRQSKPSSDKIAREPELHSKINKIELKDLNKIGVQKDLVNSPESLTEKSKNILIKESSNKVTANSTKRATTKGQRTNSLRSSGLSNKRNIISTESSSKVSSLPSRQAESIQSTKTRFSITSTTRGSNRSNKNHSDKQTRKQYTGQGNEIETTADNIILNASECEENEQKAHTCLSIRSKSSESLRLRSTESSSQIDVISLHGSNKETPPSGHSNRVRRKSSVRGSPSIHRESGRSFKYNLNRNPSKRSLISLSYPKRNDNNGEKALPEELELLIDRCKNIENTTIQNMKKVEQSHAAVTADIKKYRKQINNVLDLWEKEALEQVNNIMSGDIANLNTVLKNCVQLAEEILTVSEKVSEYKTKLLEVNVIEIEAKNTYREYNFINNDKISSLLKMESQIGEVKITHEVAGLYNNLKGFDKFVPTLLEEINVKADKDSFDCDITGMAMVGTNRLVVADADNKSVKSIDTRLNKITSHLTFMSGPWDLTMVHRGQVAVTIPSEKLIQFVSIANGLVMDRHMKVNGECHGIAYSQERLIVGFRGSGRLQIIDMKGNVLKTISKFMFKAKLHTFDWPDYVAVSKDDNSIYVSDWHRNTVTRLTWKGEVTAVYKDNLGTKMAGVAVASDGSVFACKRTSHSIVKLNPNLSINDIILEEKHGLKYPWSLCFCDEENKLYVDNNRNSNTVAVFELR